MVVLLPFCFEGGTDPLSQDLSMEKSFHFPGFFSPVRRDFLKSVLHNTQALFFFKAFLGLSNLLVLPDTFSELTLTVQEQL